MRLYNVNEQYFEKIDCNEKAYWLGFLTADGSISQGSSIRLELSNKDYDQITKFKNSLDSEHPIKNSRKNCSYISIGSTKICKDLSVMGIIQNKTNTISTPNIEYQYLTHFYRGVFDGDGWITNRYKLNKEYAFEVCFSSANSIFLNQIKTYINKELNHKKDKGYLIHRKRPNQSVWELHFGGNTQYQEICKLLYKNSTDNMRLTRKYNIYLDSIYKIVNKSIRD